jgi:exodeoxyribonuclease VII large subunit
MTSVENLLNAPEFTVSELSSALKRTVEDAYGHVRVRGEISGFRGPHSSGHCYFALKDESAKIEAVIWKFAHARMRFKPQEGLEVIATGKLTTYPGSSKYQIVIEAIEPAGVGALMALMEERKKKLAAEGLFDEARKQLLPWLPEVIGVVTSPTGAVIRDILHRLQDRFPRRVLVWPVKVQGEGSAEQVAAAVRGFNALPEGGKIPRPDLLIVARGGGSLEDLWSFNEEIVVRAAAESMIPLISAVGHETDITLIDFAADKRAPTPTAAAEMAVPVRAELLTQTLEFERRMLNCFTKGLKDRQRHLAQLARVLPRVGRDLGGLVLLGRPDVGPVVVEREVLERRPVGAHHRGAPHAGRSRRTLSPGHTGGALGALRAGHPRGALRARHPGRALRARQAGGALRTRHPGGALRARHPGGTLGAHTAGGAGTAEREQRGAGKQQ